MQVNVRIVHGSTESAFTASDDARSTCFFQSKALEWAQGRRDGEFTCHADTGSMTVRFCDITVFSVEVRS